MNSTEILCVGRLFRPINHLQCLVSRIGGSLIICISFLSLLFFVRYLYWSSFHRQKYTYQKRFIYSMIISSMSLIVVIVPSILLQCLTCSRLCSSFYCQLEGFISYLNGCAHMFMLMMISIIRYELVHHSHRTKQFFQHHSLFPIAVCWFMALSFAIPPLFRWNKYIPEGLGFHCGLNWLDQSSPSRVYLICALLFVYIVPLMVLLIINTYIYHLIHKLLENTTKKSSRSSTLEENHLSSSLFSSLNSITTNNSNKLKTFLSIRSVNHRPTDSIHLGHILRVKRLKADQRFALATIFLVSEYLLSWTPYACIALLYFLHVRWIMDQPVLMTLCAFIAKISMIINPMIYILTIQTKQFQIILFWKKCSCEKCKL